MTTKWRGYSSQVTSSASDVDCCAGCGGGWLTTGAGVSRDNRSIEGGLALTGAGAAAGVADGWGFGLGATLVAVVYQKGMKDVLSIEALIIINEGFSILFYKNVTS